MSDPESSNDVSTAPDDTAHPGPPAPRPPDPPQPPPRPTLPPPPPNAAPAPPPLERSAAERAFSEPDSAAAQPSSSAAPRGPAGYYGIDATSAPDEDQDHRSRLEYEQADASESPTPPKGYAPPADESQHASPPPTQAATAGPGEDRRRRGSQTAPPTPSAGAQQDPTGDEWASVTDAHARREVDPRPLRERAEGFSTPDPAGTSAPRAQPRPDQWPSPGPRAVEPDRWPQQRGPASSSGDANSWSYVDHIRSSELVPTRKVPPSRGWRRVVLKTTFGLVNLGQSPDERREAELQAKVRSVLRGRYKIGVLGKGGTGKTTIAALVGSMFAQLRQDDRVVAVDADTAFGKLASRIDPRTSGSYWELAGDRHLHTFADMRTRLGNNAAGLFVLAGETSTARRRVLDAPIYCEATARLDSHFTISIVDCGTTMDSAVMQAVLADLDALIIVSSTWVDGASAAGQTMDWLAERGYTGLLHRTVVVLNDSDGHADAKARATLADYFTKHGQAVIELPFDRHLRPGGVIDIDHELDRVTRRRVLEIAAKIAEHFPSTTDAPRQRR